MDGLERPPLSSERRMIATWILERTASPPLPLPALHRTERPPETAALVIEADYRDFLDPVRLGGRFRGRHCVRRRERSRTAGRRGPRGTRRSRSRATRIGRIR